MKNFSTFLCLICLFVVSCKSDKSRTNTAVVETSTKAVVAETVSESEGTLGIHPISHATMVLSYGEDNIYVDPTGGKEAFESFAAPTIVLITDIHGDHMDIETLKALDLSTTVVIAPKAVTDQFPKDLEPKTIVTLNNGDQTSLNSYAIEAIPMYNLRAEALKFHPKGRGNGYVLTIGSERIYISGDTEDIPEMRNLERIDRAFVCMNLPWTMTVDKAAEAVLEFKPKTVYPYHYRGKDSLSDVGKFKRLVNQGDANIDVVQLDWYQ